jgi:stage V sporulation protein G
MKTMDVEVADIRKISGMGNTKAAADVRIGDELLIKGLFVMQGRKGLFVSLPRKAGKDGRWHDVLEVGSSLKDQIESKVLESYELETDGVKD